MRMILGFGNKARQGKDTAALAIVDYYQEYALPAMITPFAGALRKETSDAILRAGSIFDLLNQPLPDGTIIPDWVTPDIDPIVTPDCPYGKHPKLLQWWGTEYRRAQDPDYWVKKVDDQIRDFDGVVVISDLRFINEFKFIKGRGGYTVNIARINENGSRFIAIDRDPNHISETGLDTFPWDFYLKVKTGDSELLKEQAIRIAEYVESFEN
jgi:hypothetical protein